MRDNLQPVRQDPNTPYKIRVINSTSQPGEKSAGAFCLVTGEHDMTRWLLNTGHRIHIYVPFGMELAEDNNVSIPIIAVDAKIFVNFKDVSVTIAGDRLCSALDEFPLQHVPLAVLNLGRLAETFSLTPPLSNQVGELVQTMLFIPGHDLLLRSQLSPAVVFVFAVVPPNSKGR